MPDRATALPRAAVRPALQRSSPRLDQLLPPDEGGDEGDDAGGDATQDEAGDVGDQPDEEEHEPGRPEEGRDHESGRRPATGSVGHIPDATGGPSDRLRPGPPSNPLTSG